MFDFLETIVNELKSYFVTEKISYEITGECKKCGKCCNYMYSFDTYTEKEFKIMQFLFPAYRRFYIKGKDENGNLIFACKYVTEEGLCSVYDKRLKMCRRYPVKRIYRPMKLHEGCGYKVEEKRFEDYLKKGKDEDGNFIFACKYVTKEGLCSVYNKRLKMCRRYPVKRIYRPMKLHEGCGYKVEEKKFEDYLKKGKE